jgi:hypothetical protein
LLFCCFVVLLFFILFCLLLILLLEVDPVVVVLPIPAPMPTLPTATVPPLSLDGGTADPPVTDVPQPVHVEQNNSDEIRSDGENSDKPERRIFTNKKRTIITIDHTVEPQVQGGPSSKNWRRMSTFMEVYII